LDLLERLARVALIAKVGKLSVLSTTPVSLQSVGQPLIIVVGVGKQFLDIDLCPYRRLLLQGLGDRFIKITVYLLS